MERILKYFFVTVLSIALVLALTKFIISIVNLVKIRRVISKIHDTGEPGWNEIYKMWDYNFDMCMYLLVMGAITIFLFAATTYPTK